MLRSAPDDTYPLKIALWYLKGAICSLSPGIGLPKQNNNLKHRKMMHIQSIFRVKVSFGLFHFFWMSDLKARPRVGQSDTL